MQRNTMHNSWNEPCRNQSVFSLQIVRPLLHRFSFCNQLFVLYMKGTYYSVFVEELVRMKSLLSNFN